MPHLMEPPPRSQIEALTEILHGVSVSDPYRWLEDQESPRTREWLRDQSEYARSYLDTLPGRDCIRERIRQLLDIETYDSLQIVGNKYFFRKRRRGQEQPAIFLREGLQGVDRLLLDPAQRGTGKYTAVKLLRVSPDGSMLLYEVKEGGERTGLFEFLEVASRKVLPDALPRGYLRGFAFAPDSKRIFYVHEPVEPTGRDGRSAYQHVLGTSFEADEPVFSPGHGEPFRLAMVPGNKHLGFLVFRFLDKTYTDFYLWSLERGDVFDPIIRDAEYCFSPLLTNDGRILAITDLDAPNFRIVEVRLGNDEQPRLIDIVPAGDSMIQRWNVFRERIFVSYVRELSTVIDIFDTSGRPLGQMPTEYGATLRIVGGSETSHNVFFEQESFTKPIQIWAHSPDAPEMTLWADRQIPYDSKDFHHIRVWFTARDGKRVPMFLAGRRDVLESGSHPTIMTSYGGYGVPMTPQFSVFVAFLMEHGCLFALPNIRGGSEFGIEWHNAAKRRNRQVGFNDFIAAAEWLIATRRTSSQNLGIFGGSNSGLLVAAAMTQRPELFRAVVCVAPLLDMLRYHLFDNAYTWKSEFGTSDDPDDFVALYRYSPYHNVRDGASYPATMIVSGDSDQTCNPLHSRKMTARLQASNSSRRPILLDYSRWRGHAAVLPLHDRIEALTDRLAFFCEQLQITM